MQADDVRGYREGATVLFSEENPRFNLTLELSADQMACIAVLSLYDHTSHLTAALDEGNSQEEAVPQEVAAHQPAPQDLSAALTPPEMFWFLIQNGNRPDDRLSGGLRVLRRGRSGPLPRADNRRPGRPGAERAGRLV